MSASRDDLTLTSGAETADLQRLALQAWPGEVLCFDALLRLRWANERALARLCAAGQRRPVGCGWEELSLPWPLRPEDFDAALLGHPTRLSAAELGQRHAGSPGVHLLLTPLHGATEVKGVLLTTEAAPPQADAGAALACAQAGQWQRDLGSGVADVDASWCLALQLDPCSGADHVARWERQIHPDDLDECRRRWQQLLNGERSDFEAEYRMLTVEHQWLWILQRGRVVQADASGRPLLVAGICLEIDRRKREETSSRSNESRLATALWGAQAAFWQWHVPTNRRTHSPLWNAMTGYRREQWEAASDPWRARIHPDDLPQVQSCIDAYLGNGADSLEYEYRLRTASGEWHWLLDRGRAVEWDFEGRPAVIMGVAMDIDAQKRAEIALRASEDRLQTAVWGANMGLWELDCVTGSTHWVNDWCAQYGIDPCEGEDHQGRWDANIHEADLPATKQRFAAHMAGKEDYFDAEYRVRVAGRGWRWLYERGRVTERDADGRALRMVGVCMDIDARRQEELRQHFTQPWLEQALDLARGGLWHWDVRSDVMTCTDTYYRTLGVTPESGRADAQFWSTRVHPEDLARVLEACNDMIVGRRATYDLEYRMRGGDETWLWVHDCARVVSRDEAGRARTLVGFVSDCTIRRAGIEALRISEMRFRHATAAVHGMIYEVDYERDQAERFGAGKLLGCNDQDIGTDRASWLARMHPDDVVRFCQARPPGRMPGGSDEIEYRLLHADGHYIHVRDHAVTMHVGEQGLPRRVGFIQDISHESRERGQLLAHAQVYQMLHEGVLLLDADWRIQRANAAAGRLLGQDAATLPGVLLPALLDATAAQWPPICAQMSADTASGSEHSFVITCNPQPDVSLRCALRLRRLTIGAQHHCAALLQPLPRGAVLPTLPVHEAPRATADLAAGGPAADAAGVAGDDVAAGQPGAVPHAD